MPVLCCVAAVACGRLDYDSPAGGSSPDADTDTSADAGSEEAPPWQGSWTLSEPELVVELSSSSTDSECFLDHDGLAIFLASTRSGGAGSADCYRAARPDIDAPWGPVINLEWANSNRWDGGLSLIADGTVAFVSTEREGGAGQADIWTATRASRDDDFTAGFQPLDVSTPDSDYDPWPSGDGLRLYFVVGSGGGDQEVVMAERASLTQPFGPPASVAGISSTFDEDNPAVAPDELFIVFGSNRPGGPGNHDLWYATRPDRDAPFSEPRPLPVVNTDKDESEVCFSRTGELYFSSNQPGGKGGDDIYRSRFIPL